VKALNRSTRLARCRSSVDITLEIVVSSLIVAGGHEIKAGMVHSEPGAAALLSLCDFHAKSGKSGKLPPSENFTD
jgi:hypothetical protein